jgi:ribonuclease P protein component
MAGVTTTSTPAGDSILPTRVGFVVPRTVGGAVVRNRVRRRLRHLVAERLDRLPAGAALVVRALPEASARSCRELGVDLDEALARLRRSRRPELATPTSTDPSDPRRGADESQRRRVRR